MASLTLWYDANVDFFDRVDVDWHPHMWLLSHVSLLVLRYHVDFVPLLLHKQFSANHIPCEVG